MAETCSVLVSFSINYKLKQLYRSTECQIKIDSPVLNNSDMLRNLYCPRLSPMHK